MMLELELGRKINLPNPWIHYGHIVDPKKFDRIKNGRMRALNKPDGGLWISPVHSECSWRDWCKSEDVRVESLKTWSKLMIDDDIKVYVIDSLYDLKRAIMQYPLIPEDEVMARMFPEQYIDFEALERDGYDGLWLTADGNYQCHLPIGINMTPYTDLNAWNVESMILFNLDHVTVTSSHEPNPF